MIGNEGSTLRKVDPVVFIQRENRPSRARIGQGVQDTSRTVHSTTRVELLMLKLKQLG